MIITSIFLLRSVSTFHASYIQILIGSFIVLGYSKVPKRVFFWFIIGTLIANVISLYNLYLYGIIAFDNFRLAITPSSNPTWLAFNNLIALLIIMDLYFRQRSSPVAKSFLIVLALFMMLIIIAAQAKTAFLTVSLMIMARLVKEYRSKVIVPISMLTVFLVVMVNYAILFQYINLERFAYNSIDDFTSGRNILGEYWLIEIANSSFIEILFGAGLGSANTVTLQVESTVHPPHNTFLSFTIEYGLILCLFFIFLLLLKVNRIYVVPFFIMLGGNDMHLYIHFYILLSFIIHKDFKTIEKN